MVNQIRDLNIAFGGLFFLLKYTSVLINCWQLQSQKMSSHHLKNLLPSKITKVGLKVVMHTNAIHFLRLYYCPTQSFRIRCYFFPLPRFVRFFFFSSTSRNLCFASYDCRAKYDSQRRSKITSILF